MNETETLQPESDLIPLGLIAMEIGETLGWVAHRFGEKVTTDDVGMRAIPASVARQFFAEKAEAKARRVEEQRRRAEKAAERKTVFVGTPAQEGMSPVESMVSQDPAFSTPSQDFGPGWGSPGRELLDAALADGRRRQAERRAEVEAKKAGRRADAGGSRVRPIFVVTPGGRGQVVVGDLLRVDLEDQIIGRRAGPHYVGQAQVLDDGRLSIELQQTTEAGRTARAFLEDDIVDVVVLPSRPPVVRLRVN